jgi:dipeptidyl aminopeptidase/acylaminoacyl peptidase
MPTKELVPLIPRDILFGNPERMDPQISPDGRYLAYIAPDEKNVLQVWLRAVDQASGGGGQPSSPPPGCPPRPEARMLTADQKRGIRFYLWTYDGEHLLYLQDVDGDEDWHFYAVNIRSNVVRDVTPFPGIQARMVARAPELPHELLIAMNLEEKTRHDVYRLDLRSGAIELDTRNPGSVIAWTADAQLRVRAATAATPDGGFDLLVREVETKVVPRVDPPAAHAPWKQMRHWGPEDEGSAIGFSADGRTLYTAASHDANARRLLALDVATGAERVIAEDPQYDVGGFFIHPTRRTVQAVAFCRERLQWEPLDSEIAGDFEALATLSSGSSSIAGGATPCDFSVVSRDLADRTWIIACTRDDGPVTYTLYDRASKSAERLFSHQPRLDGLPLAAMKPISYATRDGLTIHGYLTLPVNLPARSLPTVLLVHGGPWGRDVWGFDPHAQWLANRGYGVLQVNFRGSAGYGKQFLHAGDREWAGKMHDDLVDAVAWIAREGIADPKRIAIMGGSYGGYATLVGLTFTPDVFAAGVDIVGPSNLITLIRSIPPYWAPLKAQFARRVGNVETEEAFLKSRSPVFFADRIQAPLLIGQGANDPRVKQAESEQIVAAMRTAGKPVEYIVYTDEGHGFARPENRLHFYARAEAFLANYLGGRCEPAGEIRGHSGVIA